jgi:hypothetical protein
MSSSGYIHVYTRIILTVLQCFQRGHRPLRHNNYPIEYLAYGHIYAVMLGGAGGNVNILGGQGIGHFKQKFV